MIFLSIDASSKVTGWAIFEANGPDESNLLAFGEINLEKYKKKSAPLEYIQVLYSEISKIVVAYKPEICYIEDIYAFNTLTYKSLSRIRGVIEVSCLNFGVKEIHALTSSFIRKSVLGQGKMEKADICTILESRFNKPIATPGYDQSDAILVGLCGVKIHGYGKTNSTVKHRKRTSKQNNGAGS